MNLPFATVFSRRISILTAFATMAMIAATAPTPVSADEISRAAEQAQTKALIESGLKKLGVDGGYEIVIADKPDIVENTAAEELKKFLGRAGVDIKIVPESKSTGTKRFLVGRDANLAALKTHGDSGDLKIRGVSPKDDGFHLKRIGETFAVAGANPRGVLYGVYKLEDFIVEGANGNLDVREIPYFQTRGSGPGHYLNDVTEDHPEERAAYLSRCKINRVLWGSGCSLGTLRDWVKSDVFPFLAPPKADVVRNIQAMSATYHKYGVDSYIMLWEPTLTQSDEDFKKYPPEALGALNSTWRGPFKTLCVSSPLVQEHYRNMMKRFVREFPNIKGVLFYNLDGNAWLCTPALCPRCKAACKDSLPNDYNPWETQAGFVTLLTEAAHAERPDFDFCFWGMVHFAGERFEKLFSAARVDSWISTWTGDDLTVAISDKPELLSPGFVFQQKGCAERNIPLVSMQAFSNYEMITRSMPFPFHVCDSLKKTKGWGVRDIFDITGPVPEHNSINTLVLKEFQTNPDQSPEEYLSVLAARQFGPQSGSLMFQAWEEIRKAIDIWIDMPGGPMTGSRGFSSPTISAANHPPAILPRGSLAKFFKQVGFQRTEPAYLDKMAAMSVHYAKAAEYAKKSVATASDKDFIGLCYYEADIGRPTCKEYAELNHAAIELANIGCQQQCNVLRAWQLDRECDAAKAAGNEQTLRENNKRHLELVRNDLGLQEQLRDLLMGFSKMQPSYTRTTFRAACIDYCLAYTNDKITQLKAFISESNKEQ